MKKVNSIGIIVFLLNSYLANSQQQTIEHSAFPVLKVTRTTSGTGGGLNTFGGLGSGLFINTLSSNNMENGFGGGIIFGINDNTLTSNNYIARIYARRYGADNIGLLQFCTGNDGTQINMTIREDGNVGIGTANPSSKLSVNGKIHTKEVKVDLIGWSDFVFENDYNLPSLKEVEKHIKENGHLKDIPSAKEVEDNGILLGEMDSKLLQKIEELTLYTIQQQKEIERLKLIEKRLEKIEKLLESKK